MRIFPRKSREGFTLIELLVVIAIIAILIGLLLPAIQKVREAANRAKCQNAMKHLALATYDFVNDWGRFPYGIDATTYLPTQNWVNWISVLLPYLEQDPIYQKAILATSTTAADPKQWTGTGVRVNPLPFLWCPSDPMANAPITLGTTDTVYSWLTSYVAITGLDRWGAGYGILNNNPNLKPSATILNGVTGAYQGEGIISGRTSVIIPGSSPSTTVPLWKVNIASVTDGLSNTVMIGELPPLGGSTSSCVSYWASLNNDAMIGTANTSLIRNTVDAPGRFVNGTGAKCPSPAYFGPGDRNNQCSYNHIWSFHPGGAQFAFGDGSVRFIGYEAGQLLIPLSTRAGGEVNSSSL